MSYNEVMDFEITEEERRHLLATVRETITAKLEGREPNYPKIEAPENSALQKPCGAFVTLHKGSSLRGCIGRMSASFPLEKTVKLMAVEAAFGDPRFPPLSGNELSDITVEISALSPMSVCSDPQSVKVGTHGLYLVYGGRSGVLLPQVPVEQGWDLDKYLEYICIKTGLPPGSYNAPGAVLSTFTAVVFGE